MTVPEAAGWIGSLVALSGYWLSVKRKQPRIFHVANTFASVGLGVSAYYVGAWPNLFLNLCFGSIGVWGLHNRKGST